MQESTNVPRLIHPPDTMSPAELTTAVRVLQTRLTHLEGIVMQLVDEAIERLTADLTVEQIAECQQAATAAALQVADRIRATAGR